MVMKALSPDPVKPANRDLRTPPTEKSFSEYYDSEGNHHINNQMHMNQCDDDHYMDVRSN